MVKRFTLISRIKNAIKAFKVDNISTITYGIEIKKCSECNNNIRCEECVYSKGDK